MIMESHFIEISVTIHAPEEEELGEKSTTEKADELDEDLKRIKAEKMERRRYKRNQQRRARTLKLREVEQKKRELKGRAVGSKFEKRVRETWAKRDQLKQQVDESRKLQSSQITIQSPSKSPPPKVLKLSLRQEAEFQHAKREASRIIQQCQDAAAAQDSLETSLSEINLSDVGAGGDCQRTGKSQVCETKDAQIQTDAFERLHFRIPCPPSRFQFMELVRELPSPRHVPYLAFIEDVSEQDDDPRLAPIYFAGMDDIFSNFSMVPLHIDGRQQPSVEHAYQLFKAEFCKSSKIAQQVRNAPTPLAAKMAVKPLVNSIYYSRFTLMKFQIMARMLEHKFVQCSKFREALLPGRRYVEATKDSVWGCGWSKDEIRRGLPRGAWGHNKLGKMLTRLAHRGTLLRDNWEEYCN